MTPGLLIARLSASATEPQPDGPAHLIPEPPDPDNLPATLHALCGTGLPTARSLLVYDLDGDDSDDGEPCQHCRNAILALAARADRHGTT